MKAKEKILKLDVQFLKIEIQLLRSTCNFYSTRPLLVVPDSQVSYSDGLPAEAMDFSGIIENKQLFSRTFPDADT